MFDDSKVFVESWKFSDDGSRVVPVVDSSADLLMELIRFSAARRIDSEADEMPFLVLRAMGEELPSLMLETSQWCNGGSDEVSVEL